MECRHILAPTDFSTFSKQAIAYAFGWAQKIGAKLSLLHVIQLSTHPVQGYMVPKEAMRFLDDLERDASRQLDQLLSGAEAADVEVTRHVVVGVPYEKIIETAVAEKVDLIVMATHGRTGLSHMFLGSVAERVVRMAPCPVVTMRVMDERASTD